MTAQINTVKASRTRLPSGWSAVVARPRSLVGSEDIASADRTQFERGLARYIACLPPPFVFDLRYWSLTENDAAVQCSIAGPTAGLDAIADDMRHIFSSAGSPLALRRPEIEMLHFLPNHRRPGYHTWRHLTAEAFRGNSKVHRFDFEVVPRTNDLSDLITALLATPGATYAVRARPRLRSSESAYDHLVSKTLRAPTSGELASYIQANGSIFDVTCALGIPGDPPIIRLRAAAESLAEHLHLAQTSGEEDPLADFENEAESFLLTETSLGSVVRFPTPIRGAFPGFSVVPAQLVPLPADIGTEQEGITIGSGLTAAGTERTVTIRENDFNRHLYIPGQTGSGKSTLLRAIANDVAAAGGGLLFIDPHGETVEALAGELPKHRQDEIVFVDASSLQAPAPINPFAGSDPLQRDTALENVTAMFHDLFDPNEQGIVGPRWESWFRMGMMTLLGARGSHASLLDVPSLFVNNQLLASLKESLTNDIVREFWDKEMAQTSDYHKSEVLGWFSSKFTAFRTNSVLAAVLGTGADALDATQVMDENKIVLVSLSKGAIGGPVAQLLGYVYLTRFWAAALGRSKRTPFTIMVDEAQTFTKGSLPAMLAEGRKFGLRVVLANQYLAQLPDSLQRSIVGNVGNIIALRLGDDDAGRLAARYSPEFSPTTLRRMPNFVGAASLLAHGSVSPAFSLLIDYESRIVSRRRGVSSQARAVKARSSREFKRIYREASRAAEAQRSQHNPVQSTPKRNPRAPSFKPTAAKAEDGSSSFIDEWLAKRRAISSASDTSNGDDLTSIEEGDL